jgi:pimeloyl-ACP methyl ester carboxylesterase
MKQWPSAVLLAFACNVAQAADVNQNMMADTYAMAGDLVRLPDGRALNLRCSGAGGPAVILEAGGNSESSTWYRVQPQLARQTRVCAYDRAGYGFSDEGPLPRDLNADVADLHALIVAAGIPMPAVLVGHSKGSNIVRQYATIYPQQVAGLVLVDPPEQGADQRMPEAWKAQTATMVAQREAFLGHCEAAAVAGDVETLKQCLRAAPPWMGERVASAMIRNKSQPSYWRTLRSELTHNNAVFAAPVPEDESYGSIPLVLLRPADQDDGVPTDVREIIVAARHQTHSRILAASTHSAEVVVQNTSHDIQLDQPNAVITAVQRMIGDDVGADVQDGR